MMGFMKDEGLHEKAIAHQYCVRSADRAHNSGCKAAAGL
jgi:hypothetical protein